MRTLYAVAISDPHACFDGNNIIDSLHETKESAQCRLLELLDMEKHANHDIGIYPYNVEG